MPDTKFELADKLVEKLEHKMKKMNYYRDKYFGNANQKWDIANFVFVALAKLFLTLL